MGVMEISEATMSACMDVQYGSTVTAGRAHITVIHACKAEQPCLHGAVLYYIYI